MAMTECTECGKEISNKVPRCPHCGWKKVMSWKVKYSIFFIVMIFIVSILYMNTSILVIKTVEEKTYNANSDWREDFGALHEKSGNYFNSIKYNEILKLIWDNDPTCNSVVNEHIEKYRQSNDKLKSIKITYESEKVLDIYSQVYNYNLVVLDNLKSACLTSNFDDKIDLVDDATLKTKQSDIKYKELYKLLKKIY